MTSVEMDGIDFLFGIVSTITFSQVAFPVLGHKRFGHVDLPYIFT